MVPDAWGGKNFSAPFQSLKEIKCVISSHCMKSLVCITHSAIDFECQKHLKIPEKAMPKSLGSAGTGPWQLSKFRSMLTQHWSMEVNMRGS